VSTHVKATARYVRVAPNKVRQVAAHIRGQRVGDAQRILQLSPKGISEQMLKTLNSAIANAENNHELDADDLFVTSVVVNEGPQLKRFQPRAMGRAYRIRKRTSHITVSVGTENTPPPRANRRAVQHTAATVATPVETPVPARSAEDKGTTAPDQTPEASEAPEDTTTDTETIEKIETAGERVTEPEQTAETTDTAATDTAEDADDAADKE